MTTKAVRLLLMFFFGQIVQTAVMLIGFMLNIGSVIWWTVVAGLVIFCAAWLGGCIAAPEAARSKRHTKTPGTSAMDDASKFLD